MGRYKIIFYILLTGLLLSGLSWLFLADDTLLGSMKASLVYRGFPFHFYETSSNAATKFLYGWFFANVLFYCAIVGSVWYLIFLWLVEKIKYPLVTAILLGAFFLFVSVFTSSSCVTGFPIEFYVRCMGESDISFWFTIKGWIFNFLFWTSLAAVLISVSFRLFARGWLKIFLLHQNILVSLRAAWLTILILSLLGLLGDMDNLGPGLLIAIIGFPLLKKLKIYYQDHPGQGRLLFFSKTTYAIAGVFFGIVLLSIIFNLYYEGGWFDFTDLGFVLLSYPSILLFDFKLDNNDLIARLILYLIVSLNFFVTTYTVDLTMYILSRITRLFKKKI